MTEKQPITEPCLIKGEDGKCKIHHVPKKALKEYADLFKQSELFYQYWEHLYNRKKAYKEQLVKLKIEHEVIKAEKKQIEDKMVLAEADLIRERQRADKSNEETVKERLLKEALVSKLNEPKPIEPVVIEPTPAQMINKELSEPVKQESIVSEQLNQAPIKENKPPKEVKFIDDKGKEEVSSEDEEEEADSSEEAEV